MNMHYAMKTIENYITTRNHTHTNNVYLSVNRGIGCWYASLRYESEGVEDVGEIAYISSNSSISAICILAEIVDSWDSWDDC